MAAAVSPLLRPLGIAAAAIASIEALLWGILSLLSLLVSQGVIKIDNNLVPLTEAVEYTLKVYLYNEEVKVTTLMGLSIASNCMWLVVSGIMFHYLIKRNYKQNILIVWVVVTYLVCVIDFAGTVVFGLEYGDAQTELLQASGAMTRISLEQLAAGYALAYSYAPLILMVVSARGFVLWLFNLGAAIFMTYSVLQLKKTSQTEKESPRRLSDADVGSISYLYTSVKDDKDSYSRNNPTFQPEPLLSAWNIQSPTVGAARRGPWSFPETSSPKLENQASPTKILPRVGRPVSSPVAPLPPLPTPQPDYSPPLGRPVKHEPNLYDSPVRSVLKKPTQMGRTIL